MEPLDEQSQRMLAPAPNFVWPERALERIDFFKPTAQPVISLVGFEMKEPRVQNSKPYAVRPVIFVFFPVGFFSFTFCALLCVCLDSSRRRLNKRR